MRVIKDKTGAATQTINEYDIASATAVVEGQVVVLTLGKVVVAGVGVTTAILGIAAESHSGSAADLNPRSDGLKIKVYDNPVAVYETEAIALTATGGTTTTIIDTVSLSTSLADDDFIGGFAKLTYKGASSTNTDAVGTIYAISDSDTSSQELTIAEAGGAVTAGDKFVLFPPYAFAKGNLNAAVKGIVLTTIAAIPFKVVGRNENSETIEVYPTLHFYGNKNA